MENDKTQSSSSSPNTSQNNEAYGRTYNSQDPAVDQQEARNDISSVDQQEGTMNNGEGGNDSTENKK